MSQLKVNAIRATAASSDAITLATDGTCTAKVTNRSNRNMIINGACQVNQKGTGTGVTTGNLGYKGGADQWRTIPYNLGTYTVSNDSEAPDEFGNSYKLDCTTASASPAADGEMCINFRMEGNLLQGLAYGTSSAKTTTLSFWVRCTKTGNFQVNLKNNDRDRIISSVVTISSADTWEKKVITFVGDTTANQVIDNDNTSCFQIEIYLDAGSNLKGGTAPSAWEARVNTDRAAGVTLAFGDNTSNDIYFTGMQWEVGDTATDYEHKSYQDELRACYRYYRLIADNNGGTANETFATGACNDIAGFHTVHTFEPEMRDKPSAEVTTGTSYFTIINNNSGDTSSTGPTAVSSRSSARHYEMLWPVDSNAGTAGAGGFIYTSNNAAKFAFQSEL